jgi:hypothetical protein
MKRIVRILATCIALGASTHVFSDTAVCTGPVKYVAQHVPGWVVIAVGSSTSFFLCNLDNQTFLVTPQACKSFLALAIAAQAQNRSATVYVDNAPTANCADIPFFLTANTRYFQ